MGCETETSVREESDSLKGLLAGIETRFREALADATIEQKAATKSQTALLLALWGEVKATKENVDELCSQTSRLANIESDVAAITGSVQCVLRRRRILFHLLSLV